MKIATREEGEKYGEVTLLEGGDFRVRLRILFALPFLRKNKGLVVYLSTLRSLSNDDGSESVALKMNLRSFNLYRVHLDLLNMSNAGDFSWSSILKDFVQVQKEKREFVVVCSRPP